MKSSLLLLSFAACGTLAFGQSAPSSTPAATQAPAGQQVSTPSSLMPAGSSGLKVRGPEAVAQSDPSRVVATIGGKQVTAAQAMDLLKPLSPDDRKRYADKLPVLLQQVYMEQKLADQAAQLKLDQQAPWKQQLDLARANILTQAYLTQLSNAPTPTTAGRDPQQFYDSHRDDFVQCKISGILVGFTPPGTPASNNAVSRTEADARVKADDLEKKIKDGADLGTLARSESDNPQSAPKGGDLGTLTMGDPNIPAPIKMAIAKLQPGQMSEPIRVQAGFYIIKLENRVTLPLDQVRPQILQRFQSERGQAVLKQEMDKYKIDVQDPDFFNASTAPKLPSLQRLAPGQSPASGTSAPPSNR